MPRSLFFLWLALQTIQAVERVDGGVVELPGGAHPETISVGLAGGTLTALQPASLTGAVRLEGSDERGLEASFFAGSLRGINEPDWRKSRRVAGRRRDAAVDFPKPALGAPDERRTWGIAGSDTDWDDVSVQWDGFLRIPEDGTDLATASDDSSRVWLDLDHDGLPTTPEWGLNGWGGGQGFTQRTVHRGIKAGMYRIRVQYEDGGGPNACILRWQLPGRDWTPVPADGFCPGPTLTLSGPVTWAGTISGPGVLRLGDGVRLANAPQAERVLVIGHVTLDHDLDLTACHLGFAAGGRLDLAGHQLRVITALGCGDIDLANGRLLLPPGRHELRLHGAGTVQVAGEADVLALDPDIQVATGSVRSPTRSVIRTRLATPLTTVITCTDAANGAQDLTLILDLPAGIPADLGLGVWRADRQGRWFQRLYPQRLGVGLHELRIPLGGDAGLQPEGHAGRWSLDAAADANRLGVCFFSASPSTTEIRIESRLRPSQPEQSDRVTLTDLRPGPPRTSTGRRWSLAVRPEPYPENPYDPGQFSLALVVTGPDGDSHRFNGFHDEPAIGFDRGDLEQYRSTGPACFRIRFRPTVPGRHRLRLEASWADGRHAETALPDLTVTGAPWDDIVRVDAADPRFFSAGGRFVWPAGCSLNSNYDTRCRDNLQTRLTPDRGSSTRSALLTRLAAGGGSGSEVWLSPWNLGLEWSPGWPGYRGAGRYHSGHAWALDRLLDEAEALGMRINLSLFNHGMARAGGGAEEDWRFHPYSRAQGGWLDTPAGLFTDERAATMQAQLFRYLAARYGDSPAILGWKLWAEVNLAQAPIQAVRDWHARASVQLGSLDPWKHPITSHWCGDWSSADRSIGALPGIGYLTIDAYKGDNRAIADLLCASTRDPIRPGNGLAALGKPVLVTEFGGSAGGTTHQRMEIEHAIGPWAGLVSGHAGSPMLWWFEWIDQEDRFGVYGAVNRFLAGEDLRNPLANCTAPSVSAPLWCRAWSRPGRALGYLLDAAWGLGGAEREISDASLRFGQDIKAGAMAVEWWDAQLGRTISRQDFAHPGGSIELRPPPFRRHLAFKLLRTGSN